MNKPSRKKATSKADSGKSVVSASPKNSGKTEATAKAIKNLIPFKKGQCGNPKGRPKKLPALDSLIAEVLGDNGTGKSVAKDILSALALRAKRGDTKAADILFDRAYGKVKQDVKINGSIHLSDQPIVFE